MVDIVEKIDRARRVADLSQRALASLAGVSQSTVSRILSRRLTPTWPVVDELLTATGANPFTPTADVDAIRAVRYALNPEAGIARTSGADKWLQRWARIGLVDAAGVATPGKRPDLLFRASTVARLTTRPGVIGFDPDTDLDAMADAWEAAGLPWCITGSYALNLSRPGALWMPAFHVRDVGEAREAANLNARTEGDRRMQVRLIPFDGISETGRYQADSGFWIAHDDQVLLDSYASGGRAREAADIALGRRV